MLKTTAASFLHSFEKLILCGTFTRFKPGAKPYIQATPFLYLT